MSKSTRHSLGRFATLQALLGRQRLGSAGASPPKRRRWLFQPRVEVLEERCVPTVFSPTLYFTDFVFHTESRVAVTYDDTAHSFTLGSIATIGTTPGADGVVLTSDGFLAVGGQGNAVYRVNPSNGAFTTHNAGGTSAFHMMSDPNGTIYSSGIPDGPASYNSTLTNNGTAHPVLGSEAGIGVDSLAWSGSNPTRGFYTTSGPAGNGRFGKFSLDGSGNLVNISVHTHRGDRYKIRSRSPQHASTSVG